MKPYLKQLDKLELSILMTSKQSVKIGDNKFIDMKNNMGVNASFTFSGKIKDTMGIIHQLNIIKVQLYGISILRYIFISLFYKRQPILFSDIELNGVSIWNGKKIIWPEDFK